MRVPGGVGVLGLLRFLGVWDVGVVGGNSLARGGGCSLFRFRGRGFRVTGSSCVTTPYVYMHIHTYICRNMYTKIHRGRETETERERERERERQRQRQRE